MISLCFVLWLSGCTSLTHDTSQYLNKEMYFDRDMVLAETKHWNPTTTGRYWAFDFASKPYFNNYIRTTIPTHEAYQENPKKWQKWNGSTLTGWGRIRGVISKGTEFHIVDISPTGQGNSYWVTIEIDSGAYEGFTVLYGNPKHIVPGLYS